MKFLKPLTVIATAIPLALTGCVTDLLPANNPPAKPPCTAWAVRPFAASSVR